MENKLILRKATVVISVFLLSSCVAAEVAPASVEATRLDAPPVDVAATSTAVAAIPDALPANVTPTALPAAAVQFDDEERPPLPPFRLDGVSVRYDDVGGMYSDVPVSDTAQGLVYIIHQVRVYDSGAVLPETIIDIPGIEDGQVVVEIEYSVANQTGQSLVDHSPWGMIVLGNPAQGIFEAVRLRDTNGPVTDDGAVLNPQLMTSSVPPGESQQRHLRFGLATLNAEDVAWLAWSFTCPDNDQGCYDSENYYQLTLEADLVDGKEIKVSHPETLVGINPGTYGATIERGGVEASIERIFTAPAEALPEVAGRHELLEGKQALALLVFKLENHADEPRFTFPLVGGMIWEDEHRTELEIIDFDAYYRAGLGFGIALDPRQPEVLVVQPGEQKLFGVWVGLDGIPSDGDAFAISLDCVYPYSDELVLRSEDAESLSEMSECLKDEGGDMFYITIQFPNEYLSFAEDLAAFKIDIPNHNNWSALVSGDEDQCATDTIQAVLQETLEEPDWGITFQTNESDPPELRFYGAASGETAQISLKGPGPVDEYTLHLARMFYLSENGDLHSIWLTTGFSLDGAAQYQPFTTGAWNTNEHAETIFGSAGQLFEIFVSDWYVDPQGIHWESCHPDGENTDETVCDLGLSLEQASGWQTNQFITGELAPDGYVGFGWHFNPQGEVLEMCAP